MRCLDEDPTGKFILTSSFVFHSAVFHSVPVLCVCVFSMMLGIGEAAMNKVDVVLDLIHLTC